MIGRQRQVSAPGVRDQIGESRPRRLPFAPHIAFETLRTGAREGNTDQPPLGSEVGHRTVVGDPQLRDIAAQALQRTDYPNPADLKRIRAARERRHKPHAGHTTRIAE